MSAPFPTTPPDFTPSGGRSDFRSGLPAVGVQSAEPVGRHVNGNNNEDNELGVKSRHPSHGVDPLLLAAVLAGNPHFTRHHAHHACNNGSTQAPRSVRSRDAKLFNQDEVHSSDVDSDTEGQFTPELTVFSSRSTSVSPISSPALSSVSESSDDDVLTLSVPDLSLSPPTSTLPTPEPELHSLSEALGKVKPRSFSDHDLDLCCMARARIPTPHGPVFLHLYQNNSDDKDHLAIVTDPAQLGDFSATSSGNVVGFDDVTHENSESHDTIYRDADTGLPVVLSDIELEAIRKALPPIRSATLESEWRLGETALERVTRGAYIGHLSPEGGSASVVPSDPIPGVTKMSPAGDVEIFVEAPPPLVRIHSECFTGRDNRKYAL